jgi:acetate kinase
VCVHGGASFSNQCILIQCKEKIEAFFNWHRCNPANLEGIYVAEEILNRQNKWLFFAFHQTIPV